MTLKEIKAKAKRIETVWKRRQQAAKKGLLNRGDRTLQPHVSISMTDRIQEADQVFFLIQFIKDLTDLIDYRRKRMRHFLKGESTYDGLCERMENEVTEWKKEDGTGKDSQGS